MQKPVAGGNHRGDPGYGDTVGRERHGWGVLRKKRRAGVGWGNKRQDREQLWETVDCTEILLLT